MADPHPSKIQRQFAAALSVLQSDDPVRALACECWWRAGAVGNAPAAAWLDLRADGPPVAAMRLPGATDRSRIVSWITRTVGHPGWGQNGVGIARVLPPEHREAEWQDAWHWAPDPNKPIGARVLTLPLIWADDPLNWPCADLLALHPGDPTRWWRLTGEGGAMGYQALGAAALYRARYGEEGALRLCETPMTWLRAGGVFHAAGHPPNVCVLDWADAPTIETLLRAPNLIFDSHEAGKRLEARIDKARKKLFPPKIARDDLRVVPLPEVAA